MAAMQESPGDPLALAQEYLTLSRQAREGRGRFDGLDAERLRALRLQLEEVLAKGAGASQASSRRQHLRVPTLLRAELFSQGRRLKGWLTQIAEGGVFVATESPFEAGARVSLDIVREDGASVSVEGVVRWSQRGESDRGPAGMGLAFAELDDAQYGSIAALVEKALYLTLSAEEDDGLAQPWGR